MRRHWLVATVMATMALASGAAGQPAEGTPEPAPGQPPVEPVLVDVDFPGGSVVDYIETIRQATNGRVNIIASGPLDRVSLPPIQLRDVALGAAVELMDYRAAGSDSPSAAIKVTAMHPSQYGSPNGGTPIYVVRVHETVPSTLYGAPVRVWAVSGIVPDLMTADEFLAAVEAVVNMATDEGGVEAEVVFHEPSGVLIAKGSDDQLSTIGSLIDTLGVRRSGQARLVEVQRAAEEAQVRLAQIEAERHELMTARATMEAQRNVLEAELERMRQQIEVMAATNHQLRDQIEQERRRREQAVQEEQREAERRAAEPAAEDGGRSTDRRP